jgi:glycerol uptake facilitator protein
MDQNLRRAYLVELIGTFALVYFSAGVVCVNTMTAPTKDPAAVTREEIKSKDIRENPGLSSVQAHQPGLLGIALAQGLILAAMLSVTLPLSGGYLNPAVTLMLWVFNRLDHTRTVWYIGAQFLGAVLAGLAVRYTFADEVLRGAMLGTPHLNPLAYPEVSRGSLLAGTGIELVLTFFLVFAIFGTTTEGTRPRLGGFSAGLTMVACVLVGFALTGAATNPARWFGTVLWEPTVPEMRHGGFADMFVYLAGPVVGALLAGAIYFKVMLPLMPAESPAATSTDRTAEAGRTVASTAVKAKK